MTMMMASFTVLGILLYLKWTIYRHPFGRMYLFYGIRFQGRLE